MIKQYNLFNERKAADMAAYFLLKEKNKTMKYMKLIKLMYLADREHLKTYEFPISYDTMVSLEHGPILSETLYLIKGEQPSKPNGWESRIAEADLVNKTVSVKEGITLDDLGKLSRADCEIMDSLWEQFKDYTQYELRDYTHKKENCPEWKEPGTDENYKGRNYIPIKVEDICKAVGFTEARIEGFKEDLEDAQYLIDRSF